MMGGSKGEGSDGRMETGGEGRSVIETPVLPVRMLNEFAYCARLGYLMWVQGEFTDSADTVEGRLRHRVVDRERKRPRKEKEEGEEPARIHERSVHLTSERLGLTAKIDLVEGEGNTVTPVDYKRGKRPHVPQAAYEPERVQLCAQGLILREHRFVADEGVQATDASCGRFSRELSGR
jgi:CRISPR-associated protein Cas1